jgi:hypothetical protein
MPLAPFYLLLALAVALLGRNLRFGFWGMFFLAVLLTPIIGFLILLACSPRKRPAPSLGTK